MLKNQQPLIKKSINSDKTEIKYTVNVPERENNINLCLRLGKSVADCQNCIQFVKQQNARIIACGTDATIRTCYIINQTGQVIRTFPAHDLVSVKPSDWPHWVELGDDKIAAISADQDSKARFVYRVKRVPPILTSLGA